ncbi:MAG: hypothetical protein ABI614_03700 [Planctomycetota bacterium]
MQILVIALRRLVALNDLPTSEDPINRKLYFCILEAIREFERVEGVEFVPYPMYEANNQPDADDETRTARENKRPDLQFGYISRYEPDPRKSAKQVAVECKRLGESGRNDWVLNENYILHGVLRFRDASFEYGKPYPFGVMIGYVQNVTFDDTLTEVNATAITNAVPDLEVSAAGWRDNDVSQLEHSFDRQSGSSLLLTHLWIDVRRNYN